MSTLYRTDALLHINDALSFSLTCSLRSTLAIDRIDAFTDIDALSFASMLGCILDALSITSTDSYVLTVAQINTLLFTLMLCRIIDTLLFASTLYYINHTLLVDIDALSFARTRLST